VPAGPPGKAGPAVSGRRRRSRPRVAVLIETSTGWGAGLVAGIGQHVAESSSDWDLWIEPHGRGEPLTLPAAWRPDAVIARVTTRTLAEEILRAGVPAVDVSWYRIDRRIPRCSIDEDNAAQVAGRYLADLGLRRFAYVGSRTRPGYVDRFGRCFAEWGERHGHPVETFVPAAWPNLAGHAPDDGLSRWLSTLVPPVGVLAFDGFTARRVVEACRTAGIAVPSRVAVLAGEHDELISRLVAPRLSSLDHSPEQVGRRAAALVADLLGGRSPEGISVELPTGGVVTRESTDTLAIEDAIVAAAVRYIRRQAHERILVGDVVTHVRTSRRLLEQRFRRSFGRSPAQEIRRARVQRACVLLAYGEEPLHRVAEACGFEHPEVLSRVFRQEMGMPPSLYRRRFRSRA